MSGGMTNETRDWAAFDRDWYGARYGEILRRLGVDDPAAYHGFYKDHGVALRHSPNPYFDEAWYLSRYPAVARAVEDGKFCSGFDHYCRAGLATHNPHWLYNENFYRARLRAATASGATSADADGFRNGYDHYLRVGDAQFLSGSWFFDPMAYLAGAGVAQRGSTPYDQALRTAPVPGASQHRLSWYFDPEWYLQTYPDVKAALLAGEWRSALHHYQTNDNPGQYNPNPFFSEEFYSRVNHDVVDAVEDGRFRNFYEHFLIFGMHELRRPCADIDLEVYYRNAHVQHEVERGDYHDAFAHFIAHARKPGAEVSFLKDSEPLAKKIHLDMCRIRLPLLLGGEIDFSCDSPDLSVIMVVHNLFAMTLNALASLRANYNGPLQVIVVDSGSTDSIRQIERHVRGLDVVRFPANVGFLLGANAGLEKVRAAFTLYLNNDTELMPGAIGHALARLRNACTTGAVGAKLVRTNGLLQEAGSIIWRDGSVQGYLRDQSPDTPEANFVRSVDYCSGAFLMVRTAPLRQLGGFDPAYAPAYFEETDLCVRLREAGWDVVYDPAVVVLHYEYGTSSFVSGASMIARNNALFRSRHADYLRNKAFANTLLLAQARSADRRQKHVLFIEDRLPYRFLGSGFPRANDIVHALAALGHHVTLYPVFRPTEGREDMHGHFPDTVEVIWDRELPELEEFIKSRPGYYDAVWIARTHNADRVAPVLVSCAQALAGSQLVVDTEAVAAPRTHMHRVLKGEGGENTVADMLEQEFRHLFMAEKIIAVNEKEASIIRAHGFGNVSVLGHMQAPAATSPGWEERRDLLFVGAVHDPHAPNLDSLLWFAEHVLPLLDASLPPDVRFTICGYLDRRVDLSGLVAHPRVSLLGRVEDIGPVYARHRVFVAPTRFAAGIPYKLHEAAAHGLPCVASALLCEQMGWRAGQDMLCASVADPQAFADAITHLYTGQELWEHIRSNALARIARENGPDLYRETIAAILGFS
ncbi:glycosyltransferase [Acetobacter sp. TBRC 12305]|uniref:Glycosyltransferase n=2 Tax=Acetobacter garciniae TaxID=2817435 RepID=A0A939HNT7_9PROT|nr:glycosyltransferase [Acetobacter garciniae]MBO1324892.1 glycosyltransferase [Acetobacter garciniae]MBX0344583.1 glycosyltransferase [Acetobacter garciniae]